MPALIGNDAAWIGTAQADTEPGRVIEEGKLEAALSDQAHVYQVVSGLNLAAGALSTITAHTHNGTVGAPLTMPLFVFGNRGVAVAIEDSLTFAQVPTIRLSGITSENYTTLLRFYSYAPAGITNVEITLVASDEILSAGPRINGGAPSSVSTWGGGYATVTWLRACSAASLATWVLTTATAATASGDARLVSLTVTPVVWRSVAGTGIDPGSAVRSGAVAQSLVSASFNTIYDTHTAAKRFLSSYVTGRAGQNIGAVKELLTGQPADGNDSLTITAGEGHDHDGTNSAAIHIPLLSCALGAVESSDASDDTDFIAAENMLYHRAPFLDNSTSSKTSKTMALAAAFVPEGVTSVTWTAMAYDDSGDGVDFTIYSGATINATTNNSSAAVTSGVGFVQQTGALTVTAGALNYFRLDMNRDGGTGKVSAVAFEVHS
jgi:hypothetical protein